MTHVAEALIPILCSIEPHQTPLRIPGSPSSLGRNLGTRNREIPFVPAGASGSFARTRWIILRVRSCSPAEMKIFEPVILYVPSPEGAARVLIRPRSVPQWDSVRHMVPDHSPTAIFGRYRFLSSSTAWASMAAYAPCVSPGYIPKEKFAEQINSSIAKPTVCGNP